MFIAFVVLVALFAINTHARPTEEERVRDWHAKGNTWPPKWQQETDAMKHILDRREKEIMSMTGSNERWENWLQYTQNRLVPKFTEVGFELVKTPEFVHNKLYNAVAQHLEEFEKIPSEGKIDVIYNPEEKLPKFVNIGKLAWEVLEDLKPYHEAWAGGIELVPRSAYGVRLYQNGSSLVMHYDRVETHVISSIVHICHKYDDDNVPWPIEIEDHDGNLHIKTMNPGQMLFYESSKALHGRMSELKGLYYGSIFLHYQPKDKSIWDYNVDKVIEHIPPHWRDGLTEEHGSRHSGAALTTDSRICVNAAPRMIHGRMVADDHGANYAFHPYREELEKRLKDSQHLDEIDVQRHTAEAVHEEL